MFSAKVSFDDLRERLGLEIEPEGFETVGGYVLTRLGRVPAVGETFELDGLYVEVLEAERRRIHKVRVRKPAAGDALMAAPMRSRLRLHHRPAERRQVHAAQPDHRREDRDRLRQAADDADADPRRRRTTPSRRGGRSSFVDTPGIHRPLHRMNVRMVDAAVETLREVDAVMLVHDAVDASGPRRRVRARSC